VVHGLFRRLDYSEEERIQVVWDQGFFDVFAGDRALKAGVKGEGCNVAAMLNRHKNFEPKRVAIRLEWEVTHIEFFGREQFEV